MIFKQVAFIMVLFSRCVHFFRVTFVLVSPNINYMIFYGWVDMRNMYRPERADASNHYAVFLYVEGECALKFHMWYSFK